MLKTLSMSDSDLKVSADAARKPDKAHLEYEEVTFTDITDDAVLSISICPEPLCGKILKNNTTLKRHMRGKHGQIKAGKSETFNSDGVVLASSSTCKFCGKHFTRKGNMKLHMKKCGASRAETKVEDDNSGGREEDPSGENNLAAWGEVEQGSRKIENDLFNSIFEPEVQYDLPTHGVHDGDKDEGADRDGEREEDGGVGDEDDGEGEEKRRRGDDGGEEEGNIDLEKVNNQVGIEVDKEAAKELTLDNHFEIVVKEEERKDSPKELSSHEASLLSLLASGLATSANILSSLSPLLQVFTIFLTNVFVSFMADPSLTPQSKLGTGAEWVGGGSILKVTDWQLFATRAAICIKR